MGYKEENIIPIYFKTEDQASYEEVQEKGYSPFLRKDFLSVLNNYSGNNAILIDYRNYLQSIANKVESYKSLDISMWNKHSWMGFYLKLQEELGEGDWRYVSNPAGGFWGFWWHFQGNEEFKYYLQLEEDKFCFKIYVKNDMERKILREKWYKVVQAEGGKLELNLKKPSRFGNGKYMTVCVFDGEYRESDNGVIDIKQTVTRLRKAEQLLKAAQKQAQKIQEDLKNEAQASLVI